MGPVVVGRKADRDRPVVLVRVGCAGGRMCGSGGDILRGRGRSTPSGTGILSPNAWAVPGWSGWHPAARNVPVGVGFSGGDGGAQEDEAQRPLSGIGDELVGAGDGFGQVHGDRDDAHDGVDPGGVDGLRPMADGAG